MQQFYIRRNNLLSICQTCSVYKYNSQNKGDFEIRAEQINNKEWPVDMVRVIVTDFPKGYNILPSPLPAAEIDFQKSGTNWWTQLENTVATVVRVSIYNN